LVVVVCAWGVGGLVASGMWGLDGQHVMWNEDHGRRSDGGEGEGVGNTGTTGTTGTEMS
jgi:hypothetical protein